MIISKTPFRISFFGGGTDMEPYFRKYGGACISTSFNKYCYVTVRQLPGFFEYKTHLTYNKTEYINNIDEIDHPAIKNAMKYMGVDNIRLVFDADIPARSGVGSSSSFVVGMLNCFHKMKGEDADKERLSKEAIMIEREMCKELGGWQDQIAAAYGGLNLIEFGDYGFKVTPIKISDNRKKELNDNLLLYFTGFTRNSFEVQNANFGLKDIKEKKGMEGVTFDDDKINILNQMKALVTDAQKILENENTDINEFGNLLDTTWNLKRKSGKSVTNDKIDEIYNKAKSEGALGGKILGAGGGGFMLFYVPKERQESFKKAFKDKLNVPFLFENDGTKIIHVS